MFLYVESDSSSDPRPLYQDKKGQLDFLSVSHFGYRSSKPFTRLKMSFNDCLFDVSLRSHSQNYHRISVHGPTLFSWFSAPLDFLIFSLS